MADDNQAVNAAMMAGNMYGPNPYTKFQGRLPSMTTRGPATDAMGRPIQSYTDAQAQHDAWDKANPAPPPGTTLNSLPVSGNPNPVGTPLNPMGDWSVLAPDLGMGPQTQANYANALGLPGSAYNGYTKAPWAAQPGAGATTGQAGQTAAQSNPVDMTQAYMDALANPGKVTTPGANVPATKPVSAQPSVLDQFLAGQHGGQGAGNYSNQSFFDTLNRLRPQAGNIA